MVLRSFMTYSSLIALLAQEEENNGRPKWQLLVIVLTTTVTVALLLGLVMCYLRKRTLKSKGNFFFNICATIYSLRLLIVTMIEELIFLGFFSDFYSLFIYFFQNWNGVYSYRIRVQS